MRMPFNLYQYLRIGSIRYTAPLAGSKCTPRTHCGSLALPPHSLYPLTRSFAVIAPSRKEGGKALYLAPRTRTTRVIKIN